MGQNHQAKHFANAQLEDGGLQVIHLDEPTLAQLQTWLGRSVTVTDTITATPLRGLSALLDRDDLDSVQAELPPLWHWLFFLPSDKQRELGPDGHALRGGFLPPVPFPKRMWAGGRLRWHAPLRVGDNAQRVSQIKKIEHKTGRSGELLFVMVSHEIHNQHGLCLQEEHDIVYRPILTNHVDEKKTAYKVMPDTWQRPIVTDACLLFRYSALTFNGHRIHYDRDYCKTVEGYPGLVVHGPLLATMLLDLVRSNSRQELSSLEYKAKHPCFECADNRAIHLFGQPHTNGMGVDLWVQDHEQHVNMQATALFRLH